MLSFTHGLNNRYNRFKKKKTLALQAPSTDKSKFACLLHIKLDVMDVLIVPMENLLLMIVWTENPSGGKREN